MYKLYTGEHALLSGAWPSGWNIAKEREEGEEAQEDNPYGGRGDVGGSITGGMGER